MKGPEHAVAALMRKANEESGTCVSEYGSMLETWSVFVDDDVAARQSLVVSGHGDRLGDGSTADNVVRVWRRGHSASRAELGSYAEHEAEVGYVALNRVVNRITSRGGCIVLVWDVERQSEPLWSSAVISCSALFDERSCLTVGKDGAVASTAVAAQDSEWSFSCSGARKVVAVGSFGLAVMCDKVQLCDTRKLGMVMARRESKGQIISSSAVSDDANVFFAESCGEYKHAIVSVRGDSGETSWSKEVMGSSDGWHFSLCRDALLLSSCSNTLGCMRKDNGEWLVESTYDGHMSWLFASASSTHTVALGG